MMADYAPKLQIAEVLFVDLVGFSSRSIREQSHRIEQLQAAITTSAEVKLAQAQHRFFPIPTGDGCALVFFSRSESAVRCAIELTRALHDQEGLYLRMGIHTGPVQRITNLTGSSTVVGAGINTAQRVMDCGDVGHILLSRTAAESIGSLQVDWTLHDLGEAQVKHDIRLHIYNLVAPDAGNAEIPSRLAYQVRNTAPRRSAGVERRRICLFYKRYTSPDEALLGMLEQQLRSRGVEVFVDRNPMIGVDWAREIQQQILAADGVVLLLSAKSIHSEMLSYEVETAHEVARQHGRPVLLPVRVAYDGGLPEPLNRILSSIQHASWNGPQDDNRLVRELILALESQHQAPLSIYSDQTPPPIRARDMEPPAGAVPLDSPFYVERPVDLMFFEAIGRRDLVVLIRGPRQSGKTSLLVRGIQYARERGATVAVSDLQRLAGEDLVTPEKFYMALGDSLAQAVRAGSSASNVWDDMSSPLQNFDRYVRQVLGEGTAPVVWALDEVDRLFPQEHAADLFALFRSWHNSRSLEPTGPWNRLTLVLSYARDAFLFTGNLNQSPFNVGTRLELADFTLEQIRQLNELYDRPLRTRELDEFHTLLGGQPYLVRRGFYELVTHRLNLSSFRANVYREDGPYGDHLRRLLVLLTSNDEDTEVVRALLRGQPPCTERAFYRVRSAGLVTGTSVQECRIRCELYAAYLSDHLLPFVEAPNPYVPRSPLPPESPLFLGREETFEFLARHVMEQHVQRHAVLYGERRVGKTSIIRRLHRELPPERFVACMIDLQSLISSGFANFLYSLALEISDSLAAAVPPIVVSPPELQRLQQREQRFEEEFLRAVCRGLGDRRLVLALDEYEHLTTLSNSLDTTPDRLFGYLRHLMQAYTQITFVLTGAHVLTELPDPRWRTYLNLASCHRVRLLGDSEMRSLIVSPVSEAGQIYDETAVSSIASLAGGHPSFLQTICSYLVAHRNRSRRPRISEAEVTHCLEGILSEVDDVLAEVWETRSTSRERILMALIAEGVAAGGSPTLGELSLLAERQFPSANPSEISDVFARLKDREIVTEDRSDGTISFRIGLQYEWLTRYKLGSVKREGLRW